VRDEPPVETVDIFIRNWRPSRWRVRYFAAGFALTCIGMGGLLLYSRNSQVTVYALVALIPVLLTSVIVFTCALSLRPIDRIRLGDGIDAWPRAHYKRSQISHIELGPDPAEDYVDKPLPIPLCALTVVLTHDSSIRMIVSRGDALRLKEWASRHNVEVRDPLQSARLPEEPRSSI
jgi:hypothetical protein